MWAVKTPDTAKAGPTHLTGHMDEDDALFAVNSRREPVWDDVTATTSGSRTTSDPSVRGGADTGTSWFPDELLVPRFGMVGLGLGEHVDGVGIKGLPVIPQSDPRIDAD